MFGSLLPSTVHHLIPIFCSKAPDNRAPSKSHLSFLDPCQPNPIPFSALNLQLPPTKPTLTTTYFFSRPTSGTPPSSCVRSFAPTNRTTSHTKVFGTLALQLHPITHTTFLILPASSPPNDRSPSHLGLSIFGSHQLHPISLKSLDLWPPPTTPNFICIFRFSDPLTHPTSLPLFRSLAAPPAAPQLHQILIICLDVLFSQYKGSTQSLTCLCFFFTLMTAFSKNPFFSVSIRPLTLPVAVFFKIYSSLSPPPSRSFRLIAAGKRPL